MITWVELQEYVDLARLVFVYPKQAHDLLTARFNSCCPRWARENTESFVCSLWRRTQSHSTQVHWKLSFKPDLSSEKARQVSLTLEQHSTALRALNMLSRHTVNRCKIDRLPLGSISISSPTSSGLNNCFVVDQEPHAMKTLGAVKGAAKLQKA